MKKSFSFFLIISIISLNMLFGCTAKTEDESSNNQITTENTTATEELTEDQVAELVLAIDFIKERDQMLKTSMANGQGVSLMITPPNDTERDYLIEVGFNGEDFFETYYFLYLNPSTKTFEIEDILSGQRMSLDKWRSNNPDVLTNGE